MRKRIIRSVQGLLTNDCTEQNILCTVSTAPCSRKNNRNERMQFL